MNWLLSDRSTDAVANTEMILSIVLIVGVLAAIIVVALASSSDTGKTTDSSTIDQKESSCSD